MEWSNIKWEPADPKNRGGKRSTKKIQYIILHVTEGSYTSALNMFKKENPRHTSAHFVISPKGEITKMVNEDYVANHCRNFNTVSLGIEHAGRSSSAAMWTPELLNASAWLVATLCKRYNLSPTRDTIKGHSEMKGHTGNSDVGKFFPWDEYMKKVKEYLAV